MPTEQNELTQEQHDAIVASAAQSERARIAGAPEPVDNTSTDDIASSRRGAPTGDQVDSADTQEAKEPSLEEQFSALRKQNEQLKKSLDRVHGTYGQELQFIKRRLEQQPAAAPNFNEVFSRLNIDDPAFAELKTEFPELAGQFVTALNKALVRDAAARQEQEGDGIDLPPTDKETQQQDTQTTERQTSDPAVYEIAMDTLQTKHPDFLELAHFSSEQLAPGMVSVKWDNPKFGAWLDTMPFDVKEAILVGGSAEHPTAAQILRISNIMTDYKAHEAEQARTTTADTQQIKQETKPKPKVDLSKTLMPSSRQSNKVAMTDDEIIQAAMLAEKKRIANGE